MDGSAKWWLTQDAGSVSVESSGGGASVGAASTKLRQSKHAVHVEEALDKSIAQARDNVDKLSRALQDAEDKLNDRVSFIVHGHARSARAANREQKAAGASKPARGPPGLTQKARESKLALSGSVAASGDRVGFPSHAAERRDVRAAFKKFESLRQHRKIAHEKAMRDKENEGWDVTPDKDCKGSECHVKLVLDLQTPTIDYAARTGKHFLPSLHKLRKTVTKRGRLALNTNVGDDGKEIKDPAYHFVWQRPGARHVAIGGQMKQGRRSGRRHKVGTRDPREPTEPFRFDEKPLGADYGALADTSKYAVMNKMIQKLKHASASGRAAEGRVSSGEVVPAVVQLAREQSALLGMAKKIEDAADNRERVARAEDRLVHAALARLTGSAAARASSLQPLGPLPQAEQSRTRSIQNSQRKHASGCAGFGECPNCQAAKKALQEAAMKLGRSFLPFLPPKMAEEDMNLFASKTDPALEPVLQSTGDSSHPALPLPGERAEKPVLGSTLKALNGRVAQLEGSLEQSLGLLGPKAQTSIVSQLSKLMGQDTSQREDVSNTASKEASAGNRDVHMAGPAAEAAAVDNELQGFQGGNAALSDSAARWVQAQEGSATSRADADVLQRLQTHDRAVASADGTMAAAKAAGAVSEANIESRDAQVAARLKAIAEGDEAKAERLKKRVEERSMAARAAALKKVADLRKQQEHEQVETRAVHALKSPSAIKREIVRGAVVPPYSLGELVHKGQLKELAKELGKAPAVSAGASAAEAPSGRNVGSLDADADRALDAFNRGVADQQVRGAELAAGVATKLKNDFKAGSPSGKALSADRQLAEKLAQEVQAQLKGLKGSARQQLEDKLKVVETGLGK